MIVSFLYSRHRFLRRHPRRCRTEHPAGLARLPRYPFQHRSLQFGRLLAPLSGHSPAALAHSRSPCHSLFHLDVDADLCFPVSVGLLDLLPWPFPAGFCTQSCVLLDRHLIKLRRIQCNLLNIRAFPIWT